MIEKRICEQCHQPFDATRNNARFCSGICRSKHHQEKVKSSVPGAQPLQTAPYQQDSLLDRLRTGFRSVNTNTDEVAATAEKHLTRFFSDRSEKYKMPQEQLTISLRVSDDRALVLHLKGTGTFYQPIPLHDLIIAVIGSNLPFFLVQPKAAALVRYMEQLAKEHKVRAQELELRINKERGIVNVKVFASKRYVQDITWKALVKAIC